MTTPWQPGFQGVTVVPPGYNDPHNWSPASALQLVAATALGGVPLVNGTPTILSWTAPNDGQMHRVLVFAEVHVTSAETGGAIGVSAVAPDGTAFSPQIIGTSGAAGVLSVGSASNGGTAYLVAPGSTFSVRQASALTVGAATLWAELWAA